MTPISSNAVTYLTIVAVALSVVGGKLAASTTEQRALGVLEAVAAPVSEWKGLLSIVAFGAAVMAVLGHLSVINLVLAAGGGLLAAVSTAVFSRARAGGSGA